MLSPVDSALSAFRIVSFDIANTGIANTGIEDFDASAESSTFEVGFSRSSLFSAILNYHSR